MIKKFIDKYFINDSLKKIPYIHSKARVLAYVHFFALSLAVLLYPFAFLLDHNENVPLLEAALLILFLSLFFRYKGNLIISGNLLAALIFIVLSSAVESTGGIYSDNLLWMLLAPLIALLFASRRSGIIWTTILVSFTVYLYFEELKHIEQGEFYSLIFDVNYYLISYAMLFIAIIYIVHIFEKGREEIIDLLIDKNEELEANKTQLKEQHDLLVNQKKSLEKLSIKLKSSNSDLEYFAQTASHDLKQPLRVIKSYIELIKKDKSLKLEGKTKEYMNYVVQSSNQLDQLLNDLLALAQVGKEASTSTEVNLNDLIIIVKNNLAQRIKETNAVIHHENLPTVFAPKSLMIQLFQNLISNGIKFQRKNMLPVISIKAEIKQNEVIIKIKDNGIGIEKEYQKKIFNIFERLHSQTEYQGSGIGLHTSKKIIASIGKKIWLTSTPGLGTTFYFSLPIETLKECKKIRYETL